MMGDEASKPEAATEAPEMDAGEALLAAYNNATAENGKLRDELLRALAEVENTRRRGERQSQEARAYAVDRFARDLLAVADNLSRALELVTPEIRAEAGPAHTFFEGVELTEKSLQEAFARHGLKRTGARGEAFDANLHQAVAQVPSEVPAGAVAEVFQPGYTLSDRTLRPAMVAVSAGQAAGAAPAARDDEPPREGKIDIKV
jgi:molecular chaperone GrpE